MHFVNSLTKWKVIFLTVIIAGSLAFAPQAVNARPSLQDLQDQIDVLEAEIGVEWMGLWDSGTEYAQNNAVVHNGSSYIATETS